MTRKLDFTLSPSFQNLGALINQKKTNGMKFILILVGMMTDFGSCLYGSKIIPLGEREWQLQENFLYILEMSCDKHLFLIFLNKWTRKEKWKLP